MGNQVDGEICAIHRVGGQAGAIDNDGALAGDVLGDVLRGTDFEQAVVADGIEAQNFANAVYVAGHQMAADHVGQAQGLFQVDRARLGEADRARQGFRRDVDSEAVTFLGDDGQADTVVGNGVTECDFGNVELAGIDMQATADFARGDFGNAADCRDDSREHGKTCRKQRHELYHARLTG